VVSADQKHRYSGLSQFVRDRISRVRANVLFLPKIASDCDRISRALLRKSKATSERFEEFLPPLNGGTFGKTYEGPVKVDIGEMEDSHGSLARPLQRR
jgi:hypothetical protein